MTTLALAPPLERYEPEPVSAKLKLIDRGSDLLTGINDQWRNGIVVGDLSKIQDTIKYVQELHKLLTCLECEAHGQEI